MSNALEQIEYAPVSALKPYPGNARTHSKRQIRQIAASIERFQFTNPVLVDDDNVIVAGHGRVEAAKLLGIDTIPVRRLSHLSPDEIRAYRIADNRFAELAGWDSAILAIELQHLAAIEFKMDAIGFETAEIDIVLDAAQAGDPNGDDGADDEVLEPPARPVTALGDVWVLGRHRLVCGDALNKETLAALMGGEIAQAMFTDPPYNVPIDGFASGKGKAVRREFAMASGEMSRAEFETFLTRALGAAAEHLCDGAIAFVCMDWRHIADLLAAGEAIFDTLKNICVWTKSNGGMGSLYRSQHEFVCVFKKGKGAHANNVELGRHGRNRTNVWAYAGANAFGAARDQELAMHPTVKPVALIEDALKDVTARGSIVLDPFGGSGSTLIAAERCGRSARLIELDPAYCDVILARYARCTGAVPVRVRDGRRFEIDPAPAASAGKAKAQARTKAQAKAHAAMRSARA